MNLDILKFVNSPEKEKRSPYPERPIIGVDKEIDNLESIIGNPEKRLNITEKEKIELISFENEMGGKLEQIDKIKINSTMFYGEYFLTAEGKEDFKNIVGMEIDGQSCDAINIFLLENRQVLAKIKGKDIDELTGRAASFVDKNLKEKLISTIKEDGEIDFSIVDNPNRIKILFNPENAFEKIQKLRELKRTFKKDTPVGDELMDIAKRKILQLYFKKINTLISSEASFAIWAKMLSEKIDPASLSQSEVNLTRTYPGITDFERMNARMDHFIYGVDEGFDDNGMKVQIGEKLKEYVIQIEEDFINSQIEKEQNITKKGIDSKKFTEKNISEQQFTAWVEEYLDKYDLKSVQLAAEYDPKRAGRAEDGKWQFVARDKYKQMSVSSKQGIVKSGTENKTIGAALATLLSHEMTHVLQAENRERIPLKLFRKIGGDRNEILSEAGAMEMENRATEGLFGYSKKSHPYYIHAMIERLNGGTYMDCVKKFYEKAMEGCRRIKNETEMDEVWLKNKSQYWLNEALTKTKRLFRGIDSFDSKTSYLANSKDTVYAEQVIFMEKLRERGLEKLAFIGGVNVSSIAVLLELGLFDINSVLLPDLEYVKNIWNEKKSNYLLENSEAETLDK